MVESLAKQAFTLDQAVVQFRRRLGGLDSVRIGSWHEGDPLTISARVGRHCAQIKIPKRSVGEAEITNACALIFSELRSSINRK